MVTDTRGSSNIGQMVKRNQEESRKRSSEAEVTYILLYISPGFFYVGFKRKEIK